MRIINESDFHIIKVLRLNHKGKIIGKLVGYKGTMYLLKYCEPQHYFVKHRGIGCDFSALKEMVKLEKQMKLAYGADFKLNVLVFYNGIKEKRYYLADLWDWVMSDIDVNYSKNFEGNDWETYGRQLVLPLSQMSIFGYDMDDEEVRKHARKLETFRKFIRKELKKDG